MRCGGVETLGLYVLGENVIGGAVGEAVLLGSLAVLEYGLTDSRGRPRSSTGDRGTLGFVVGWTEKMLYRTKRGEGCKLLYWLRRLWEPCW